MLRKMDRKKQKDINIKNFLANTQKEKLKDE